MLCHVAKLTDVSEKRNASISEVKQFNSVNKLTYKCFALSVTSAISFIRNATVCVVKSFEFS